MTEMKIGRTMDAALQETADRLRNAEFQFFVITIAIQRETGGNLAETLANLADGAAPARADEAQDQGDVVGIQGVGLYRRLAAVHRVRPDHGDQSAATCSNFFIDQRLMVAGIGGLLWMGIGAFIMAKMVNFEI